MTSKTKGASKQAKDVASAPDAADAIAALEKIERGRPLLEALRARTLELGYLQQEVADFLGLQRNHYSTLLNGGRYIGAVNDETLARIAVFLRVSKVRVYMLAGILDDADFFEPAEFERLLQDTGEAVTRDPRGPLITIEQWNSWPVEARYLIALLHPQAKLRTLERAAMEQPFARPDDEGSGSPGTGDVH